MKNSFPFSLNPFRILILLTLSMVVPAFSASQPFLWIVEKEGRLSHLMGTIHSSHPQVRDIPDSVMEALARSKVFLPEIDLTYENIGIMTAAAFDFGGEGWESRVPERLHSRVRAAAQQIGLPELMLRNLAFEMIPLLFAVPPSEDFFQIMDVRLYQEARNREIEVKALESVEEQLAIFQNLDDETIVRLIEEALSELENGFPEFHRLIAAYASGEENAVEELIREMRDEADDDYVESILDHRNRVMTERALPALEAGDAFVAVGLAHLLGPGSITEMLQDHGFKVTRLGAGE